MKNVYDILVNFKKKPYEFYEWNKKDDVEHIKVIPSFKVSNKVLYDFINYEIKVNGEFLNQIFEKTQTFSNHLVKTIDYACILYNEYTALAVEFNKEGLIIGKSKLLFDEEDDIISSNIDIKKTDINYLIENKKIIKDNYTRKEINIITNLENYLDNIFIDKKEDEIKYIYFECFNEVESDIKKAYYKLKDNVKDINLCVIDKLRSLIKVLKR